MQFDNDCIIGCTRIIYEPKNDWGILGENHNGYVEGLNKKLKKNDILYGCTKEEFIKVKYNNGNLLPYFSDVAQVMTLSCLGHLVSTTRLFYFHLLYFKVIS